MTAALLDGLVPATVAAVEAFEDPPDAALFPQEEEIVRRAVDKRRREFTTARTCARTALRRWLAEPGPILTGARGAPVWPDGFVGSLTHCTGYRAAAVARATDIAAIGIDAEPHDALPGEVGEIIMLPAERVILDRLADTVKGVHWDRLLFSAKESTYKAWFPLTGRWLDFFDAEITIEEPSDVDRCAGWLTSRLLVTGPVIGGEPLRELRGRWLVERGLVLTAIVVEP